ncbi:MAG: cache domain-containing protein [Desulfoprunum sp.]|nr:cache domain-containing protein [Desulfoprunum sp.]
MVKSQRISLSSAPFYASLVVILSLGLFTGTFWALNEYEAYKESISNIRDNYQKQYRARLIEEMGNVNDFIEFKRSQTDILIENEIRQKVQTAYTIASHIYSQYKDEKSTAELRSMVVEILRPIRWNNDRGYYFAGRVEERVIDLFADDPFFEGKNRQAIAQETNLDVVGDIIKIIKEKGAGIYRYNWSKPEYVGSSYQKISCVKYFKPFDWFVGAGVYIDDMEKIIQEDVLAQVQKMHFGLDGEVFGFRFDGTIICNRDERLIGRSVNDFVGKDGTPFGQMMSDAGQKNDHEGFVSYAVQKASSEKIYQKLSYVKSFNDWGWVFVTSMNMDEMEKAIADETRTYIHIAFKNAFLFVLLFIVAVSLLLLIAYFYSLKIKHGISLFTNFFRNAADAKVKIENADLAFAEFEDLGKLANRMIDDRIHKELLLHRDELRLDTLLRLGMMEKYSLQEKYDFILQRIVQITRSEEGYLALVNAAQTHISLCSFFPKNEETSMAETGGENESRRIEDGGLPGIAVLQKKAVICNSFPDTQTRKVYPYNTEVRRYLDVPIYNGGKIVVVAGVCNNSTEYDNSDVRQMAMLLEGMWLHVLKTCSEIEMARLERQIIAVSLEERSKIGRDLHDGLGSHLSGVEMLSKVLQKKLEVDAPDKALQLGRIRNLIREAIEKTRRLAHGLYPVHIIEQGLEASIEELIVELESLYYVECSFSYSSLGEPLDNNAATHIYYIIREAVFNAARHGMAKHIAILIEKDHGHLSVTIQDDGQGIADASHQKGMGLHTMKYRAKAIGASLFIQPGEQGGTVVSLSGEVQE